MKKFFSIFSISAVVLSLGMVSAHADSAKPGQSMTHMKTNPGITSTLEGLGVILFAQGGATSGVIGDSLNASDAQYVFHIPANLAKSGVEHKGSNIIFFNTLNNKVVQVRNPVIDLTKGVVTATIPQASADPLTLFTITNASTLKPAVTNDKKAKLRTTSYKGAALSLAPGISAALIQLLELPAGSLTEGMALATADVTLYGKTK
jgi:hypothetical protein